MKEKYIPAAVAYRKLKYAQSENIAVYMYGATGYGKTRMVQEYLKGTEARWLLAANTDWDISAIDEKIVVVDDLQFLSDEDRRGDVIELIKRENIWTVILGRMPMPQWLMMEMASGRLTVISESNLSLGRAEIGQMVKAKQLSLSDENIAYIQEAASGNAYAIATTLEMIRAGKMLDDTLAIQLQEMFAHHLENWVIPQWRVEIQEFLMKLSVVDEFTLPLAVMITGDDQAAQMLKEIAGIGNFLENEGNIYRLRTVLLTALRERAVEVFGLNEYRRYISNAGLYYETCDDILNALRMYEMCERKENIRALLIRNGRRHAGAGFYWELRRYYLALEDEEIETSPILMSAMSLLYSLLMNPEKSEYWYDRLKIYSQSAQSGEKREVEELLLYLDISLPHRGSVGMIDIIKRSFSLIKGGGIKLPEMSVTNNGPSAMNGGKDFCDWSKKDQLLADTIGKIVEHVNGKMGRGLTHAALCESFYEKGGKDADVAHHAMLVQMDVEGGGRKEILFVAVGIQTRLSMLVGNRQNAFQILDAFEEKISSDGNVAMLRNLHALRCRVALMAGDYEAAEKWLLQAPNEKIDFCTLERYSYMTKLFCYVEFNQNQDAYGLIEQLRYYAEINHRTYYMMETGILLAIVSKRMGMEWKEMLIETLSMITEYRFIRIISEKGAGILPLLKEVRKDYLATKNADEEWFARVLEETAMVAGRYPKYLNSDAALPSQFSETAIAILRMQAEGNSIKEIAARLQMAERTVKYHAAENYRKLNAKGKTDAVQIARGMNLI